MIKPRTVCVCVCIFFVVVCVSQNKLKCVCECVLWKRQWINGKRLYESILALTFDDITKLRSKCTSRLMMSRFYETKMKKKKTLVDLSSSSVFINKIKKIKTIRNGQSGNVGLKKDTLLNMHRITKKREKKNDTYRKTKS